MKKAVHLFLSAVFSIVIFRNLAYTVSSEVLHIKR